MTPIRLEGDEDDEDGDSDDDNADEDEDEEDEESTPVPRSKRDVAVCVSLLAFCPYLKRYHVTYPAYIHALSEKLLQGLVP